MGGEPSEQSSKEHPYYLLVCERNQMQRQVVQWTVAPDCWRCDGTGMEGKSHGPGLMCTDGMIERETIRVICPCVRISRLPKEG